MGCHSMVDGPGTRVLFHNGCLLPAPGPAVDRDDIERGYSTFTDRNESLRCVTTDRAVVLQTFLEKGR